ncbi:hypothetical protein MTO96_030917 [Rhipicephalus appendiculatus]
MLASSHEIGGHLLHHFGIAATHVVVSQQLPRTSGLELGVTASVEPRPFYVFGHMVNSLEEVDQFVGQGVNAIEADLTFASDGTAEKFYHGGLCDCGRDCEKSAEASTYLSYLRDGVIEGK